LREIAGCQAAAVVRAASSPLLRTATADLILGKVETICKRIDRLARWQDFRLPTR
jgi:hypothetical protein